VPTLDPSALKKQLAAGRLGPVYVLLGEDLKLIDRMVEAMEATIDPADRPFAVEHFHAGDEGAGPVDIAAAARGLPMLGDRRLVIVRRAERLLKPKRNTKSADAADEDGDDSNQEAADVTALEEYIQAPVSSTTLVFVAAEIDRSRRLVKRLLEHALVAEFGGLAANDAAGRREARQTAAEWLRDEVTRSGKSIDADAARLLVERAGHDITKLRGDVERLWLFTEGRKRIVADDVLAVVSATTAVDDDWAVPNALAAGNAALALAEVGKRLDRGDSPHGIVGQLRWWVSNRLVEGDASRVKPALEALLRTDLALKSSGGDDRVLVERLVLELTGRPLASRYGPR
jgi:DNA polymerase-3 subunit delta